MESNNEDTESHALCTEEKLTNASDETILTGPEIEESASLKTEKSVDSVTEESSNLKTEESADPNIENESTCPRDNGLEMFIRNLKNDVPKFSKEIACETVRLLERIINNSQWVNAKELMEIIKNVGVRFEQCINSATHTVVFNMVKRVLKIIRDEYSSAMGKDDEFEQDSLHKMIYSLEKLDFMEKVEPLKKSISANLRELIEEFERSSDDIAAQSPEHIHYGEVILTFGHSRTVEKFLKKAGNLKCKVYVAEAFPSLSGHDMVKNLAESGIQATLIQDAAVFVLMPSVDKVIIGTHSLMANGALRALIGTRNLAAAADFHKKPFIVLAPTFKFTPEVWTDSDQKGFNHFRSPEELIPYEDRDLLKDVEIINPAFDLVESDFITLVISNVTNYAPSYIYRLISETYHPDDYKK